MIHALPIDKTNIASGDERVHDHVAKRAVLEHHAKPECRKPKTKDGAQDGVCNGLHRCRAIRTCLESGGRCRMCTRGDTDETRRWRAQRRQSVACRRRGRRGRAGIPRGRECDRGVDHGTNPPRDVCAIRLGRLGRRDETAGGIYDRKTPGPGLVRGGR